MRASTKARPAARSAKRTSGTGTPASVALPSQAAAAGKPMTAEPPVSAMAMPVKISPEPRVARIGGRPKTATATPLKSPAASADGERGGHGDGEPERARLAGGAGGEAGQDQRRDDRREVGDADDREVDAAGQHGDRHREREDGELGELERHRGDVLRREEAVRREQRQGGEDHDGDHREAGLRRGEEPPHAALAAARLACQAGRPVPIRIRMPIATDCKVEGMPSTMSELRTSTISATPSSVPVSVP